MISFAYCNQISMAQNDHTKFSLLLSPIYHTHPILSHSTNQNPIFQNTQYLHLVQRRKIIKIIFSRSLNILSYLIYSSKWFFNCLPDGRKNDIFFSFLFLNFTEELEIEFVIANRYCILVCYERKQIFIRFHSNCIQISFFILQNSFLLRK